MKLQRLTQCSCLIALLGCQASVRQATEHSPRPSADEAKAIHPPMAIVGYGCNVRDNWCSDGATFIADDKLDVSAAWQGAGLVVDIRPRRLARVETRITIVNSQLSDPTVTVESVHFTDSRDAADRRVAARVTNAMVFLTSREYYASNELEFMYMYGVDPLGFRQRVICGAVRVSMPQRK